MVNTAEVIAYVEVCVYAPIFILTAIVVIRHGFHRQLGWIFLALFCAIRIAGAVFKIESVHNPTSKTDIEWAAILQSVGLSPLLLASLGLLKRVWVLPRVLPSRLLGADFLSRTDEVSDHIKSASADLNLRGIPVVGLA